MNLDISQLGKYLLLFLTDGIAGYFLQFVAYAVAIYAFNNMKIKPRAFLLMVTILSVFGYCIKKLPISFGFPTILMMISCILISSLLFKTAMYPTVLSVLFSTVSVLIFESLVYGFFSLLLGTDNVKTLLGDTLTVDSSIRKALMGIPINIFLIAEMIILYKYMPKKFIKDSINGENSKKNS